MKKILILKNWNYKLDLLRQTPGSSGIWNDCQFSLDVNAESEYDFLVILNRVREDIVVRVPSLNVWAVVQEPPNEVFRPLHRGQREFSRVYCQDQSLNSKRHILAPPSLPWFINRNYDELIRTDFPRKDRLLSCISSKNYWFSGHKKRLEFIAKLKSKMDFDLFGWGFKHIPDKWDALAPYKYSIVLENHQSSYYWSEKLSDCLLSFTLPIYFGCTNVHDYFPKGAVATIDINSPYVFDEIQEIINSGQWEKRVDAISEARKLILEKYQIFPFLADEINKSSEENKYCENVHISSRSISSLEMLLRSKVSVIKNDVFKRIKV